MTRMKQPIAPRSGTEAIQRGVVKAGLDPRLHLHSLRHSSCTHLPQRGALVQEVQKLAGHSTIAVAEMYNHMVAVELRNAVQRINLLPNRSSA